MPYVTVTFARGETKKFAALVQLQGTPFHHYRLGTAQAYAIEIAVSYDELKEWLPKLRHSPIAKLECVTGESSENVTVVGTIVAPSGQSAIVAFDVLVLLPNPPRYG